MFIRPYSLLYLPVIFIIYGSNLNAQDIRESTLNKVVIDPGHGGHDAGASGAISKEKNIVLDISLKVGKLINDKYPDVEVIYTRKKDVFIELDKRSEIANKAHADLFISIHANSVEKGAKCPSGAMTFVMGSSKSAAHMEVAKRENSVILLENDYSTRYEGFDPKKPETYIIMDLLSNVYFDQSVDFAVEIQNRFKQAKRTDRGVNAGPFSVLWKSSMPSVLIEIGFICHSEEEKYISSAAGKEKLATAIFEAFCSYKTKIEDRSSFLPDNRTAKTSDVSVKAEFCVQISTSSKPIDTDPNNFKKYTDVERIKVAENQFKYITGRTTDYAEAQEKLKRTRADFDGAFIVGIVEGKIVSIAEALKLLNE